MAQIPRINLDDEELRFAKETPPAEKLIAGARLFDFACTVTTAGIHREHPTASDEQVLEILRERLEWASRWE